MQDNKGIDYIAQHYRQGLFVEDEALRRIRPAVGGWWTRARVAAACVAVVVVSATAAVLVNNDFFADPSPVVEQAQSEAAVPEAVVRVIDFEATPLTVVVDKIKDVYGVEVDGLPENADDYSLSLHYEGSADDLIETINEILETDMTVRQ